jgi:hypothetical protein
MSFLGKRREAGLSTEQIAQQARLAKRQVYLAEIGGAIPSQEAWAILHAFNQLTNQSYTFPAQLEIAVRRE